MEFILKGFDETNLSCVYKITFGDQGFYIGSTHNIRQRVIKYRYAIIHKTKHINKRIKSIIDNVQSVVFEPIEAVPVRSDLKTREDFYIKEYCNLDSLLNRTKSAFDNTGLVLLPEEITACSERTKGMKHSEEERKAKSIRQKGRKLSAENRQKISTAKKGIRFSDEHRKKLSDAKMGKKPSARTIELSRFATMKRIFQYDKENNLVAEYSSSTEAAAAIGVKQHSVSSVANKPNRSIKGFRITHQKIDQ